MLSTDLHPCCVHDEHLWLLVLSPPAAAHEDDEGEKDDLDHQDHECPLAHSAELILHPF